MMGGSSGRRGRSTHGQIQLSLTAHVQIFRMLTVQSWTSRSVGCHGRSVQMLQFFPLGSKVISFVRHLVQFVRQNFDLNRKHVWFCFLPKKPSVLVRNVWHVGFRKQCGDHKNASVKYHCDKHLGFPDSVANLVSSLFRTNTSSGEHFSPSSNSLLSLRRPNW